MRRLKLNHILSLIFTLLLVGCVDGGGRKGRPLIQKLNGTVEEESICTRTYDAVDFVCRDACPSGTHIADSSELTQLIAELDASGGDQDEIDDIKDNISAASQVCVAGSGILRPDGEVYVKSDYCACKGGKHDIVNNCESFCSGKNDAKSTLYGSVTLGPNVELNNELGSLENWCNNEITGSDFSSPGCFLEVYDGSSKTFLTMNIPDDSNTFTVDIDALDYGKVYVATIVETQSGSNVRSDSFQIYRKVPDTSDVSDTPLKIMPVSQYTCVTRLASESDGEFLFEKGARVHFYFPANATPPSLPEGTTNTTVCHDSIAHGQNDSPLFPRLELIPQNFALWDQSDSRFADLDNDGNPDINKEVADRILEEFNIARTDNPFILMNWPNMPSIEGFTKVANPNLGFFMKVWLKPDSGLPFCPTQEDYNSSDPVFSVMKEIVGVDTEGLYMAESEPVTQSTGSFLVDVIMIRENLLKKIWFYYENNQHFVPDEITSGSKTIMFYYPPDENDPYVRKSSQKIYTVRFPSDIGKQGSFSGLETSIKPRDKRFGCIPALD